MKNYEDVVGPAIAAGTLGFIAGLLFGCVLDGKSEYVAAKKMKPVFDYSNVRLERKYTNGFLQYHAYYEDSEYFYEATDLDAVAAIETLKSMVTA